MKKYLCMIILFKIYLSDNFEKANYSTINETLTQNYKYNKIYKKNVIIAVVERYSLNTILPFFKSLISANFNNCDVVIFVRNVSQIIINYLKSIGVIVHEIPDKYKNVIIRNLRWKLYKDFLKENLNKYKLVFHSDTRDCIFQSDLFKYYESYESFLGISLEDGTLNQGINKKWMIDYIGVEKHKKILNETIICVGTLWGTLDKFIEFCTIFWERLKESPNNVEQAIGNYIIYWDKLFDKYLIKSDNFGPIMTIGRTKKENIILDEEDNILNFRGDKASVIHQYDRKKDIQLKIINKFCPELLFFQDQLKKNNELKKRLFMNQIINMKKNHKNIIYFLYLVQIFIVIFCVKTAKYLKIKKINSKLNI